MDRLASFPNIKDRLSSFDNLPQSPSVQGVNFSMPSVGNAQSTPITIEPTDLRSKFNLAGLLETQQKIYKTSEEKVAGLLGVPTREELAQKNPKLSSLLEENINLALGFAGEGGEIRPEINQAKNLGYKISESEKGFTNKGFKYRIQKGNDLMYANTPEEIANLTGQNQSDLLNQKIKAQQELEKLIKENPNGLDAKATAKSMKLKSDITEIDNYRNYLTGQKISGKSQVPVSPTAIPKSTAEIPPQVPSQLGGKTPQLNERLSYKSSIANQEDSVNRVVEALKEAKPLRGQQETLYSQERSARLGRALAVGEKVPGEKGFYTQLGQLKGELPKVEYESLRNKIGQKDIDNLFQMIQDHPGVTGFDKIAAKEGLAKIFGQYGGRVPTEGELILLNRVFPKELVDTLLAKRPFLEKLKDAGLQIANIPRSVMASFDLSFGLRQGAFAAPRYRGAFFDAWKKQFKIFGSETAYKASQEALIKHPDFQLARESRISFTDVDSILTQREERFASSWAEKIPLAGRGIRASGRAYTAFANKFRMDIFSSMVKDAERLGLNPRQDKDLSIAIAQFINNATGRGSLGGLERASLSLNAFFFSPRLAASRLNLLNPIYYTRQTPFVRKEALKTLLTFAGTVGSVLGLAKLGGAEVGTNPLSSDFLKIKVGNTRIDILAGFQQYIRMASQLLSGKYVSSTTGKEITLGEGYKPLTRFDILQRQIESKENPVASFVTGLLKGQNYIGQPINVPQEIAQRFIPLAIQDMYDIAQDDPSLLPISTLGIFGVGLQTYSQNLKNSTDRLKSFR